MITQEEKRCLVCNLCVTRRDIKFWVNNFYGGCEMITLNKKDNLCLEYYFDWKDTAITTGGFHV